MGTGNKKEALVKKLHEQQAVRKTAIEDAERIRQPHCRDGFEIAEERERAVIVDNTLVSTQKNIADIKTALRKAEQGTYGLCEVCSDEIAPKRLEILPAGKLCLSCQEKV